MNNNFKIMVLIRLGTKPESTAPETDALITQPPGPVKKKDPLKDTKRTIWVIDKTNIYCI